MNCRQIAFLVGSILIVHICDSIPFVVAADSVGVGDSRSASAVNHVENPSSSKLSSSSLEPKQSHLRTPTKQRQELIPAQQTQKDPNKKQTQKQFNEIKNDNSNPPSRILSFFSEIKSRYNHTHIETPEEEDADSDDYYQTMITNNIINGTTLESLTTSPSSSAAWYTLSHYIEPTSILYDSIEGFFLALFFCLFIATFYTNCYYYCFTRCGLCPDDRIYKSVLNRKARKMRRKNIVPERRRMERRRGVGAGGKSGICYCCPSSFFCCAKDDDSAYYDDNKGDFAPLSTERDDDDSVQDGNESDQSSLSQDSALSLEYGDEHLADEYGENTDRLIDTKIETAAKAYFEFEEKQAELLLDSQNILQRNMRRNGGSVGNRSRRSRGTRSVRSQTSSILSSESGDSSSCGNSDDDDDDDHSIEMESAMMDLELAEQRAFNKQLEMKNNENLKMG